MYCIKWSLKSIKWFSGHMWFLSYVYIKIGNFEHNWGILGGVDTMTHGWEASKVSRSILECFGINLGDPGEV